MKIKASSILWGLAFIGFGLLYMGNSFFSWDLNIWQILWRFWPLFILIPSLSGFLTKGINSSSLIGIFIGLILLLWTNDFLDFSVIQELTVPIILILIGFSIIFKSILPSNKPSREAYERYEKATEGPSVYIKDEDIIENDFYEKDSTNKDNNSSKVHSHSAEYSAVFGENIVNYPHETFDGACINSIFGSVVLDLRDAIITSDVVINSTCIFAGADIIVPSNVNVKVHSIPIFGGTSNKARPSSNPNAPTIFLNSTCMFGGVDIK